MNSLSADSLLRTLQWRYATKQFDPARRIDETTWSALEDSLVLTPSSFGLQPWKFIVITNQELKDRLVPHCWNQRQVADCSHLVVMATMMGVDEPYVDRFIQRNVEVRGLPAEALEGYRRVIVNDVVLGERSKVAPEWAARQAYIALGQFMLAAATLGVDTCPMEGFVRPLVEAELDLGERGLQAAVLCPAGYRAESDKYAAAAKVRWPSHEVIERIV